MRKRKGILPEMKDFCPMQLKKTEILQVLFVDYNR